jgi:hypothetical protein
MSTTTVAPKIIKGMGLTMSKHYNIKFVLGVLVNSPPNRVMEWNVHDYPTWSGSQEQAIEAFKNTMKKSCFGMAKVIVLAVDEVNTNT